ncbi:MAG: FAD-dependent oxidoreductase [Polyangiales bacterium]
MTPSRRDVLATFLGAAFAVSCRRSPRGPHFSGEIVGPDAARGHRLRDPALRAQLLARTDLPETRVRCAIVGGGPAGLSAAWRLKRGGLDDFAILELEDVAGGTSRSGETSVTRYPWGAHYVPVPAPDARALLTLFGEMGVLEGKEPDGTAIVAEEALCRAPEERLFYRGAWYEGLYLHVGASRDDLAQYRAFRRELVKWQKWRDSKGRRAFTIPTSQASDDPEVLALDATSMRAWMDQRGFVSPRLRWFVDYACRDDYALSLENASAWAGLFYFVSRMGPDGHAAELMTWPDGNGRLVRHLTSVVGTKIQTGITVIDVARKDREVPRSVTIVAVDPKGEPRRIVCEHAILATPRHVSRAVFSGLPHDPVAFDYGAWCVANLHLSGRPGSSGVPFAWDNVLYESPSLGYVVATHQTGKDHGPTVWTWYYAITDPGPAAREKLLAASFHDWADVAYQDLARAHEDLASHLDRVEVVRWGHAMTRPIVGQRKALAVSNAQVSQGSVHFAHTDLSGVALFEEAYDHGVRAAEEVLAALDIKSPSIR